VDIRRNLRLKYNTVTTVTVESGDHFVHISGKEQNHVTYIAKYGCVDGMHHPEQDGLKGQSHKVIHKFFWFDSEENIK